MIRTRHVLALTALVAGSQLGAQDRSSARAPRVGVVLSGGGAKGIAHIGVLRVLEAHGIHADIVTGTSMGALVGGLYAIGYTPASLDSIVTTLDWASFFLDEPERRFQSIDRRFAGDRTIVDLALENWRVHLPPGVVQGQRIGELLARLTWRAQAERDLTRLPRPFTAMATDIETGQPVVLDTGSLALAMRASMSIPGLFDPVRIGGHLLVDGGITRNLPAREARRLGADILVCSDVAVPLQSVSELRSLLDVLLQTMNIYVDAVSGPDRERCDVLIRPHARDLTAADFGEAARFIALGDSAARAQSDKLRAIAHAEHAEHAEHVEPVEHAEHAVQVSRLELLGISGDVAAFARRRLGITVPGAVTPDQLETAVQRLYATELFDRVTWRLDARGADTVVVVTAERKEQDQLGIGVRYDDAYDAAILFTARLRNRLGVGSTTNLDVRLGEQVRVAAEHVSVGVGGSRLAVAATASYRYSPMHLYTGGVRAGGARVNVGSVMLGTALLGGAGGQFALGVELKGEHADVSTSVAGADTTRRQTYATGALVARAMTLDRPGFPSRGHMVSVRSEYAIGDAEFVHHVGHLQVAVPVTSRVSLTGRATAGSTSSAEAPLQYQFMLGGAYPSQLFAETQVSFVGLRPQERAGTAVTRVGAGVQWEVKRRLFATLRTDAGHAGPDLTSDPDDYTVGIGLGLGALTPAGPLEVMVSKRPSGGRALLQFSLGWAF